MILTYAILMTISALVSIGLITLLLPLMRKYALARPNARSSHTAPTPQGGGMAVIGAIVLINSFILLEAGVEPDDHSISRSAYLLIATMALAVLGWLDDTREISIPIRLAVQFAAAIALVSTLPNDARALPAFTPAILEQAAIVFGTVWFINLTNFMDGIDEISVVECVPLSLGCATGLHLSGASESGVVLAVLLAGAMLGFLTFNRHPARLFLGDVGSLSVGFLMACLLVLLAVQGHLAAALLLPLYYLLDATQTLFHRLREGEPVWQAHRTHAYQRALHEGRLSVRQITGNLLVLNTLLVILAILSIMLSLVVADVILLVLGVVATVGYLRYLEEGQLL